MSRISSTVMLLACVGVPVGLYFATAPVSTQPIAPVTTANLCFTAGAVTYRVSPDAAADYRVKIDDARPDLRIALVDGVETADFALVDGVGGLGACESTGRAALASEASGQRGESIARAHGPSEDARERAGGARLKTVGVVGEGSEADVTMSLSREPADADFKLFVHSAHLRPSDVAALVTVIRLQQRNRQIAEVR
jgi:hypothetical protein